MFYWPQTWKALTYVVSVSVVTRHVILTRSESNAFVNIFTTSSSCKEWARQFPLINQNKDIFLKIKCQNSVWMSIVCGADRNDIYLWTVVDTRIENHSQDLYRVRCWNMVKTNTRSCPAGGNDKKRFENITWNCIVRDIKLHYIWIDAKVLTNWQSGPSHPDWHSQ